MAHPDARPCSSLETLLVREIAERGPISVARFMDLALGHPRRGYYRRRDPFGAEADFATAPELSQAFGEIIGLWLAEAWAGLGRPRPVRMVELGPGSGRLMADLLHAGAKAPGFVESLEIHLVETSAPLRASQRERLAGIEVSWHDGFDQVPPGPTLLVANEFLDALPVHQLACRGEDWVERRVAVDHQGRLTFHLADGRSSLAGQIPQADGATPGTIAEVSPARNDLAREIGARLRSGGGVALVIDYGAWAEGPTGDTLQAVRSRGAADPLEAPGEADLSTHVDFHALAKAAAAGGAVVYGPIPQGPFLRAFGIELRIARLLRQAAPEQRRPLRSALFRLIDASAMGELYKVLVLSDPSAPPPPGFTAATLTP